MVNVTIYGIHGSYGIYYIYNMKVNRMAISGSTAGHGFFGRQPADAAERRRHPPSPRWGAGQRGAEVRRFSVSGAGRTEGARFRTEKC